MHAWLQGLKLLFQKLVEKAESCRHNYNKEAKKRAQASGPSPDTGGASNTTPNGLVTAGAASGDFVAPAMPSNCDGAPPGRPHRMQVPSSLTQGMHAH